MKQSTAAPSLSDILDNIRAQTNDIFGRMDSAEEEIRAAMKRHPERADWLFGTFIALRPLLPFCSDKLYRVHCYELLERVAVGGDLVTPTGAEMLELLQRVSAFIPFHSHAGALYRLVFEEVFPGELGAANDGVETLNERFPGETDGLRLEVRTELLKVTNIRESAREDRRWRGEYEAVVVVESPAVQLGLFAD